MSEFWMVSSKQQLQERIKYFAQWLETHWDWQYAVQWKVTRYVPKRSLSQNALFHMWIREMWEVFVEKDPNLTEEQMKKIIKYKFLGLADEVIGKTLIPMQLPSTSDLTTGEMMFFMDQVQDWAMDHGVMLTCPADSEFMKLKQG
jgi:hypothetical protein